MELNFNIGEALTFGFELGDAAENNGAEPACAVLYAESAGETIIGAAEFQEV